MRDITQWIVPARARARCAERRGGGAAHVTLNLDIAEGTSTPEDEIIDVNEALVEVAELDPRLVRVVEMRHFGGMSNTEMAMAGQVQVVVR